MQLRGGPAAVRDDEQNGMPLRRATSWEGVLDRWTPEPEDLPTRDCPYRSSGEEIGRFDDWRRWRWCTENCVHRSSATGDSGCALRRGSGGAGSPCAFLVSCVVASRGMRP